MKTMTVHLETNVEVEDELVPIVSRLLTQYKGLAPLRNGVDPKESYLVIYTFNEDEFQRFLHTEFMKLIPDLEVVKEGDINTLSWPTKLTPVVLDTVIVLEGTIEL